MTPQDLGLAVACIAAAQAAFAAAGVVRHERRLRRGRRIAAGVGCDRWDDRARRGCGRPLVNGACPRHTTTTTTEENQ